MAKSTRVLTACLLLAAVSSYEAVPADSLLSHWTSFKVQYGKHYASQAEEAKRMELFAKNKLRVDQFNQQQSEEAGYTLEVNHLSDRTDEEFKQLLGFKMSLEQMRQVTSEEIRRNLSSILNVDGADVPDSLDWRKSGRVSSVKDQGLCGSCWAFAATGVLEGQELPEEHIKTPISLSVQDIMDCGRFSSDPCAGGRTDLALIDVADKGGVESDHEYPYLAATGHACKFNKTLRVIANHAFLVWTPTSELGLKTIVAKYGPVAVSIEVIFYGEHFRHYKSGVYTDEICHNDIASLNHAVLVVGYGTDPQEGDFWIVKNSWASDWGEEGYIRMARNKNNMCGIATYPVLATF